MFLSYCNWRKKNIDELLRRHVIKLQCFIRYRTDTSTFFIPFNLSNRELFLIKIRPCKRKSNTKVAFHAMKIHSLFLHESLNRRSNKPYSISEVIVSLHISSMALVSFCAVEYISLLSSFPFSLTLSFSFLSLSKNNIFAAILRQRSIIIFSLDPRRTSKGSYLSKPCWVVIISTAKSQSQVPLKEISFSKFNFNFFYMFSESQE